MRLTDVQATALHTELLQDLPGGPGLDVLTAVLNVHAPIRDGRYAACRNCVTWLEERAPWPCETIAVANQWAHVDEIMAAWQEYLDS